MNDIKELIITVLCILPIDYFIIKFVNLAVWKIKFKTEHKNIDIQNLEIDKEFWTPDNED